MTAREKRFRRLRIALILLIVLAAIVGAGFLIKIDRYVVATGYVTMENYAEVRPSVTGRVESYVSSGTQVEAGQVLVRLSRTEEQASLAEANSLVRKTQAELVSREAEVAEERRQHQLDIAEAKYMLEDVQNTISRIDAAIAGSTETSGDLSVELASLRAARDDVQRAKTVLVRREAELEEARRALKWDVSQAELVLENARSEAARTAQLVESKLASGRALDEARLKEKLAEVNLQALKSKDDSVYDKELAVLRQDLKSRESAVTEAEARLRRRHDDLVLKGKLAELKLKSLVDQDMTLLDKELAVKREELAAAKESVVKAQAQLRARDVLAPISGIVVRYEFVIGELVQPTSVLMEIYGGEKQVLKLRVSERYATRIAAGQRYRAELAPYRGLKTIYFDGEVKALRNVIQSEGRETYRVAYCSFDAQGMTVPPGTTAEARIYYGRSCFWLYLFGLD